MLSTRPVMRGRSACTARGLAEDLQAGLKEVVALQG
jgi:hypothetical protein